MRKNYKRSTSYELLYVSKLITVDIHWDSLQFFGHRSTIFNGWMREIAAKKSHLMVKKKKFHKWNLLLLWNFWWNQLKKLVHWIETRKRLTKLTSVAPTIQPFPFKLISILNKFLSFFFFWKRIKALNFNSKALNWTNFIISLATLISFSVLPLFFGNGMKKVGKKVFSYFLCEFDDVEMKSFSCVWKEQKKGKRFANFKDVNSLPTPKKSPHRFLAFYELSSSETLFCRHYDYADRY